VSAFAAIDSTLDDRASKHQLRWGRDHDGIEVRTMGWALRGSASIQIWVDPPAANEVTVFVAHNTLEPSRRKIALRCTVGELSSCLNRALETARDWKTDLT
jgi:hypothetical protein